MPVYNRFFRDPNQQHDPNGLMVVGAVLPIEIHVPPQIAQVLADRGSPIPTPVSGLALVDTGATMTCVHEPVLQQLGLNPVGVVKTGTASGTVQQSMYPARLVSPDQGWTLDINSVIGVNLTGQQAPLTPPQDLIALIGRNLLQHWATALSLDLEWSGRVLDCCNVKARAYRELVIDQPRYASRSNRLLHTTPDHTTSRANLLLVVVFAGLRLLDDQRTPHTGQLSRPTNHSQQSRHQRRHESDGTPANNDEARNSQRLPSSSSSSNAATSQLVEQNTSVSSRGPVALHTPPERHLLGPASEPRVLDVDRVQARHRHLPSGQLTPHVSPDRHRLQPPLDT